MAFGDFGSMGDFWFWPFGFAAAGIWLIVMILFFIFWVWMIVDCAKRNFRNTIEKVVWLVVIVFGTWIGALVYLIVIKSYNQRGLMQK